MLKVIKLLIGIFLVFYFTSCNNETDTKTGNIESVYYVLNRDSLNKLHVINNCNQYDKIVLSDTSILFIYAQKGSSLYKIKMVNKESKKETFNITGASFAPGHMDENVNGEIQIKDSIDYKVFDIKIENKGTVDQSINWSLISTSKQNISEFSEIVIPCKKRK
jgi:hypothetical protein